MKLSLIIIFFFIFFQINVFAQVKNMYKNLGSWNNSEISIISYITKEKILSNNQKGITELPKFKYEVVFVSKSKHKNKIYKTWIYNAKVFINDVEVSIEQYPTGFTTIINTIPTIIYRYETDNDSINFRVTWKYSRILRSNN